MTFDMYYGAWVLPHGPQDFKQIFYTTSALNGGSNYVSFGNADSDALIDSIRVELDDVKRAGMEKRLQQIMHDQCGLHISYGRLRPLSLSIKDFRMRILHAIYPVYWEAGFKAEPSAE